MRRPARRPTAREWATALEVAETRLRECRRSPQHLFSGVTRRCPWCARVDAGLPDPFPAADGTVVRPRPPSRVASARRRALRWVAARIPRRARAAGAAVAGVAVLAWVLPLIGLSVALVAVPAAARVIDGGRDELSWWRWRALVRRVRLAYRGVAAGARRMHWTSAAATAGAGVAVFAFELDPWSAGRAAAATAAFTHALANLRQ